MTSILPLPPPLSKACKIQSFNDHKAMLWKNGLGTSYEIMKYPLGTLPSSSTKQDSLSKWYLLNEVAGYKKCIQREGEVGSVM